MVSANKILTVSYGTFSCTLEGFDEPFSTMKAIAEYFRDLAADDRYFGAEPPTPDAEMLHRIAEREIQRRVEAKVQDNGVVLRASDLSEAGSTSQHPHPVRLTSARAEHPASAPAVGHAAPMTTAVAPAFTPAEDVIDDFAQDRVAAKLLRIRAAVAQPPAAETGVDEEKRARAEENARREEEQRAQAEENARREEEQRAQAEDQDDEDEDADQLLQARVLKISRSQPLGTDAEDEDASDDLAASTDAEQPFANDESDAPAEEEARPAAMLAQEAEDDLAEPRDAGVAADDEMDAAEDAPEADAAETELDDGGDPVSRVAQAVGETGLSPQDEAELFQELAELESEKTAASEDGRTLLTQTAASEDAAMSRLMKQAENELSGPENRRRLSAIEHLRAAVAATRAERKDPSVKSADGAEDAALGRFQDDLADVVRPRRPVSNAGRGAARRPAAPTAPIAPLVLVSEQRIDRTDAPQRTIQPVRPRRMSTGNLALEDDAEDYDDDGANILNTDASFADFAARVGAADLPDLLEAAAVYCAQVEGRPNFSRPQLLRKLGELPDHADISREEGLRGFGRLLRDGRIVKIRRGQFAVKDGSRYLPEARRISEG
jgi:hypothetical protein